MMASTRIMAGIVSVLLSSLTLLAGSASAECAWVLWTETQERSLKPKPDPNMAKATQRGSLTITCTTPALPARRCSLGKWTPQ